MTGTDPSSETEVQAALDAAHTKVAEAHDTLAGVMQALIDYGYATEADMAMRAVVKVGMLRYELFRAKGGQL